jgi:predicted kinase
VVDLYLSHRAWVRAKVACLVAADPRTAPAKVNRKAREAASFLALAASYLRHPPQSAPVIAVGGVIGSGKTTLAAALGLALELPVVSSDLTRKHLAGLAATEPGGAALYSDEHTRRTYAELCRRAGAVLDSGRGVILDATFAASATRARPARSPTRPAAPSAWSSSTATTRRCAGAWAVATTAPASPTPRADRLGSFRRSYRAPDELPSRERLLLDGTLPVEELVRRVRDAI